MSAEENPRLAQSVYEAFGRGDMEALAEVMADDTECGRAFVNHEAHVWTFRDGKLPRFEIYLDTAAAAAAHRVE